MNQAQKQLLIWSIQKTAQELVDESKQTTDVERLRQISAQLNELNDLVIKLKGDL